MGRQRMGERTRRHAQRESRDHAPRSRPARPTTTDGRPTTAGESRSCDLQAYRRQPGGGAAHRPAGTGDNRSSRSKRWPRRPMTWSRPRPGSGSWPCGATARCRARPSPVRYRSQVRSSRPRSKDPVRSPRRWSPRPPRPSAARSTRSPGRHRADAGRPRPVLPKDLHGGLRLGRPGPRAGEANAKGGSGRPPTQDQARRSWVADVRRRRAQGSAGGCTTFPKELAELPSEAEASTRPRSDG